MMEFTKERLERVINLNDIYDPELTKAMARQLLAGMEHEPVAWISDSGKSLVLDSEIEPCFKFNGWNPLGCQSSAAPQLPQPAVVSEAQSKKLFDEWSGGDGALGELRASGVPDEFISMLKEFSLATWEACREAMLKHSAPFIVTSDPCMMEMPAPHDIDAVAAMLQGAEPVSQHYTLRDGWVAVPVEPTEAMVIAGFEAELREEFRDPEAWEAFEAMSGCEQAAHRAKLCWAAMIAAAPQQEVK